MSSPPKSHKLLREEAAATAQASQRAAAEVVETVKVYQPGEAIPVKSVKCYNDFVAILQFRVNSPLELGASGFKSEGMVIGTGPGMPGADGKRIGSQLNIGDVVTFFGNPVTALEPKSGVYAGQKIIIVAERCVICLLSPVLFKMIDEQ